MNKPLLLILFALGLCACQPAAETVIRAHGLEISSRDLAPQLHLFIYPDYIEPALLDSFEAIYGVEVIMDYFDTPDALLAKMRAGGTVPYDLIVPADYLVTILRKLDLLEPLDTAAIPNLRNLSPRFRHTPYDPGNQYAVCYQWGTTGLGLRTDLLGGRTPEEMATWRVLFEPGYYTGPLALLDDPREALGAALRYLGYSYNDTSAAHLAAATDLLLRLRPQVKAYNTASTGRDFLVSGETPVVLNHSGDVWITQQENITYVIPREGSVIWTDNLCIPRGAAHKRTAEVFINFILDAQNGAALTNYTFYASPNEAALTYIAPEIRTNPMIYPDSATFGRLYYLEDLGEATRAFSDAWTRVKASR
ncbi:MAG: spermidine/putrescine ABC transporter substrate-binding protein [Bacteroidia bacterium]|nr:spermidine/putrescine ABC transporter substrate-binding protein [Bacteroidia bacterium]